MALNYTGFTSYFTGERTELTTLTEGNERVVDESRSTFSETSSPNTSEGRQGSDEKLRDQNLESKIRKLIERNQHLELEIKNLKESYEKKLEKKTAEVQHYTKSLQDQEERHQGAAQEYFKGYKCLKRKTAELETRNQHLELEIKNVKESYEKKLEKKTAEVQHYAKRNQHLELEIKNLKESYEKKLETKTAEVQHYAKWFSIEESKSKKLEGELRDCSESRTYLVEIYNTLRDSYNNDVKRLAGEAEYLQTRLTKKDEELRVTREELKQKTARLASAFEKRLKHDQRRVENTIEFNTPTDIEKDFSDFFDGERIDACDIIESILHSEEAEEEIDVEIYYQRLACIIFVTAYEQVKEAREGACDLFANVARWLIDETPRMGQELCVSKKKGELSCGFLVTIGDFFVKKDVEISRDVLDGLILSLKQTAHLCNLDCFENVVEEIVLQRWNRYLQEEETQLLPTVHGSRAQEVLTQLSDYIKACIRLAWRMVTQVPPLQLEYKSLNFDKAVHKLARCQCNADDQRVGEVLSENIACYLWPALLEGGGRIIFPGEVLCKYESDYPDYVHI